MKGREKEEIIGHINVIQIGYWLICVLLVN